MNIKELIFGNWSKFSGKTPELDNPKERPRGTTKVWTVALRCELCNTPMETEYMAQITMPPQYFYWCPKCKHTVKDEFKYGAIDDGRVEMINNLGYNK